MRTISQHALHLSAALKRAVEEFVRDEGTVFYIPSRLPKKMAPPRPAKTNPAPQC